MKQQQQLLRRLYSYLLVRSCQENASLGVCCGLFDMNYLCLTGGLQLLRMC